MHDQSRGGPSALTPEMIQHVAMETFGHASVANEINVR